MPNICDFDRILKTKYNLQHFTRNCRMKNLDDFERDEADAYFWSAVLLNVKEKGMTICYIMSSRLVLSLREGKCCAALIKNRCEFKGEQVITFHMAHQRKSKNINVVPGQLFWRQCDARFLLQTDSLYWWSRQISICYRYWQWIHWMSNTKEKAPINWHLTCQLTDIYKNFKEQYFRSI